MKDKKNQVIFIRGGEAFDNKEEFYEYLKKRDYDPHKKWRTWKDWLEWSLSEEFDSFAPLMPNKQWADYEAWRIWFEKLFTYISKDKDSKLILIGQSLGGIFLAKYLSENKFPKKIDQLHLVSPMFDNDELVGEKVTTFELDVSRLKEINKKVDKIFFYHSEDDHLVPIRHSLEYLKHMSITNLFTFKDRGHFSQPAFMEILEVIRKNLGESKTDKKDYYSLY